VNVKETDRYRDRFRIPMPIATELGRLPLGGFPRAPALWVENHYEVTKVAHDDSISAGIDSRKLQSHSEIRIALCDLDRPFPSTCHCTSDWSLISYGRELSLARSLQENQCRERSSDDKWRTDGAMFSRCGTVDSGAEG